MSNSLLGGGPGRMEVMFYLVLDDNFPNSRRRGGEGQTEEKHEQKLRGWPAGQENV